MTPTPPPEGPWKKVAMDIMGPFKTMNGKYAIVLVDYISKWCEVELVTDITTSCVIKFLQSVFVRLSNLQKTDFSCIIPLRIL